MIRILSIAIDVVGTAASMLLTTLLLLEASDERGLDLFASSVLVAGMTLVSANNARLLVANLRRSS